MTEAEWLATSDPDDLLDFIAMTAAGPDGQDDRRRHSVRRRERLLGVACCRRIWPLLAPEVQGCIELAERFADGLTTQNELLAAKDALLERWLKSDGTELASQAGEWVCSEVVDSRRYRPPLIGAAVRPQLEARGWMRGHGLTDEYNALADAENAAHLYLLRDIFGNPFRPVTFSSVWLTPTAVGLAQSIYADQAFDRLSILADALQDAGCEDADVLGHCRGDGPHVRGCWVVDGVLGKG